MYVIAGASGNTGKVAAQELLARGKQVRVLGRSTEKLLRLVGKGAEAVTVNLEDSAALSRALTGATAAYLLIPPNLGDPDYTASQKRTADSLADAVTRSGIKHVVFLSSIGAQHPEGTGPIKGLHYAEQRLSSIPNLNLLCVRAAYFMENFYMSMPAVKQFGMLSAELDPDVVLPMITTGDIGRYVAERLLRLDFSGTEIRELLGQRDLNMTEAARVIGEALGQPGMRYQQMDESTIKEALAAAGISSQVADALLEMARAIKKGLVVPTQKRTSENTTPTSFEEFARQLARGIAVGK